MSGGFSIKGKTSHQTTNRTSSSPSRLQKNLNEPQPATKSSTVSFLESEANQRTQFRSILQIPRETRKPENAVLPPRPRTPGELLPALLQQEISRSHEQIKTDSQVFEPNISDADKFTLQGEQLMSLPETNSTAIPETTMIPETSQLPGKRHTKHRTNTKHLLLLY